MENKNTENLDDVILNPKTNNEEQPGEQVSNNNGAMPNEIISLKNQLEKQQEESKKYYDLYLRSLAELENYKRRTNREKEEYSKYAILPLIKKLLPIVDDLKRALEQFATSKDLQALSKGVEMITSNLQEFLKNEGVEPIDAQGKPFDPQYHQPLMVEESDEYPQNTVIEELQCGYMLHDRVIRPSLVKVSK
ncbi:MAG: nucleotide exchange factor GrpE [Syntrophomonadaceae bacterium]|jgi:molecular chaperone GrpE